MKYSMPDDIFDVNQQQYPWTHTVFKNAVDAQTLQELNALFDLLDWDSSEHDDEASLMLIDWHKLENKQELLTGMPSAKYFLDRLESSEFIEKTFNFYGIDYDSGYTYNVAFDLGDENNYCDWHSDLKNKDTVTLQYYINVEYPERTLRVKSDISDEHDTEAMSGDAVIFHSGKNTYHKFNAGRGSRRSIRLRIQTNLNNPEYIHHLDAKDSIGVLLDATPIQSGSRVKRLQRGLAHISYLQLRECGFNNIVCFEKPNHKDKAQTKIQQSHIKKYVVIPAGAMVGKKTKEKVVDSDSKVMYSDSYSMLDIAYLYPTEMTTPFLENIYYHNIMDNTNIPISDDKLLEQASMINTRLSDFYKNEH